MTYQVLLLVLGLVLIGFLGYFAYQKFQHVLAKQRQIEYRLSEVQSQMIHGILMEPGPGSNSVLDSTVYPPNYSYATNAPPDYHMYASNIYQNTQSVDQLNAEANAETNAEEVEEANTEANTEEANTEENVEVDAEEIEEANAEALDPDIKFDVALEDSIQGNPLSNFFLSMFGSREMFQNDNEFIDPLSRPRDISGDVYGDVMDVTDYNDLSSDETSRIEEVEEANAEAVEEANAEAVEEANQTEKVNQTEEVEVNQDRDGSGSGTESDDEDHEIEVVVTSEAKPVTKDTEVSEFVDSWAEETEMTTPHPNDLEHGTKVKFLSQQLETPKIKAPFVMRKNL